MPRLPVAFTPYRVGAPGAFDFLFVCLAAVRTAVAGSHHSPRPIAVHPSILPIPYLLLNLFVLACYPLPCLFTLNLEPIP
jgi:hypothetical protein